MGDCSSPATNYENTSEVAVDQPQIMEVRWKFTVVQSQIVETRRKSLLTRHKLWRCVGCRCNPAINYGDALDVYGSPVTNYGNALEIAEALPQNLAML